MDKTETIKLIFDETKLAVSEISEYSKLQIQAFSIFFVFTGVAFKLGFDGGTWAWVIIQLLTPVFLFAFIEYEQNIMVNSMFIVFNENRINKIADSYILSWQNIIGYVKVEDLKKNKFIFHLAPMTTILVCLIVYLFPVYHIYLFLYKQQIYFSICYSCSEIYVSILYSLSSIILYITLSVILIHIRTSRIEDINLKIKNEKYDIDVKDEIVRKQRKHPTTKVSYAQTSQKIEK